MGDYFPLSQMKNNFKNISLLKAKELIEKLKMKENDMNKSIEELKTNFKKEDEKGKERKIDCKNS